MKPVFLSLAAFIAILCLLSYKIQAQVPPRTGCYNYLPNIYKSASTAYNFSSSASQCKTRCTRRSVKTWSDADWALYAQLYNKANDLGYIADLERTHALHGTSRSGCTISFHFVKEFYPWHRFYLAHFEQLLQKVDHDINPGKAATRGEFCLGFWDWGYQETPNADLRNAVYQYVFGTASLGTLQSGSIPNGPFRGLRENLANKAITRSPSVATQFNSNPRNWLSSWNKVMISSCLGLKSMGSRPLTGSNDEYSFWQCVESSPHGAIHTSIGGQMTGLKTSSADPVFWLHHTMVDYLWWVWQKGSGTSYPSNWNAVTPAPFYQWQNNDAKDYARFCYDYGTQAQAAVAQRSTVSSTSGASTNFAQLDAANQDAVSKTILQGEPGTIPKERYNFLTDHASSPQEADNLYGNYIRYVNLAKQKHSKIVNTYLSSFNRASNTNFQPETAQAANASTIDQAELADTLNSLTGRV